MVQNLQHLRLPGPHRRLEITEEMEDLQLEDLVTKRTSSFFDVLMEGGKVKSQSLLLEKPPVQWMDDPFFNELQDRSSRMHVVNNTAERGISLIQTYNETDKGRRTETVPSLTDGKPPKEAPHSTKGSSNVIVFQVQDCFLLRGTLNLRV